MARLAVEISSESPYDWPLFVIGANYTFVEDPCIAPGLAPIEGVFPRLASVVISKRLKLADVPWFCAFELECS